ncbi:MAG: LuxR C-terminal-related transcriptional regulator [Chloroflexaceae bacterium]
MNLFIVENNDLLVEAITRMIDQHPAFPDLVVTGYAVTRAEALNTIATAQPDIVLLDLSIAASAGDPPHPQHGLALLHDLRRLTSPLRILVYSQWHQPYYLWAVWEAEAQGFLEKDTSSAELIAALKRVVAGEYAFTSAQLQMIQQRKALPELTAREQEVLKLLAQGLNYEEIAPTLNISKGTVRTHMRNLFDKSGTRSRWELVTTAHRLGLLQHEAG